MEMNSFRCSCSIKIPIVLFKTGCACRKPSAFELLLLFLFCFVLFFHTLLHSLFFVFVLSETSSLAASPFSIAIVVSGIESHAF